MYLNVLLTTLCHLFMIFHKNTFDLSKKKKINWDMNNFGPNCALSNAARRFTRNMTATTVNKSKAHK